MQVRNFSQLNYGPINLSGKQDSNLRAPASKAGEDDLTPPFPVYVCRGGQTRTDGLLVPNQAIYQLIYTPIKKEPRPPFQRKRLLSTWLERYVQIGGVSLY